jgi:hypothetical protein
VENALQRLDGVGSLVVDLQTNMATMTVPSGFSLVTIPNSIKASGYTPGKMWITKESVEYSVDYSTDPPVLKAP